MITARCYADRISTSIILYIVIANEYTGTVYLQNHEIYLHQLRVLQGTRVSLFHAYFNTSSVMTDELIMHKLCWQMCPVSCGLADTNYQQCASLQIVKTYLLQLYFLHTQVYTRISGNSERIVVHTEYLHTYNFKYIESI